MLAKPQCNCSKCFVKTKNPFDSKCNIQMPIAIFKKIWFHKSPIINILIPPEHAQSYMDTSGCDSQFHIHKDNQKAHKSNKSKLYHTINIQIAKMIHKLTFKHNYKILSDHWPLKAMPYYQKPQRYHVNKPRPNYKLNKNIQPHEPEPMQQL